MPFPLASIKSEEQLQEAQKVGNLADHFEVDASVLAANF
jgi:hypothetical protein